MSAAAAGLLARGSVQLCSRLCCSTTSKACSTAAEKKPKTSIQRPTANSTHDWIGPPNPVSNLRPVVYRVPEYETPLETRLRKLRQETEDWNQDFWTQQNITFSKEKESFIAAQLRGKGLPRRNQQGRKHSLDSEEMASFYKKFLDVNRTRHADYNREWYRRNFTITFLMARVALQNIWRSLPLNSRSTKKGSTET